MMKIATKITFVMILLALVATNGFGLRKIPRKVVPQRDCRNDCIPFIFICHPKVPTCVNGNCVCIGLDNNNSSTKQERHNNIDGEKSKLLG
ncbi:hypothetical protein HN51_064677 [Arachis hypogaea]|nr:uncharacterized protein DS421_14g448750 [Arachis hypogaea]